MIWFEVEIEVFIYGKETELVEAQNKDDAILVAIKRVCKNFSCPEDHINIISCKIK